MSTARFDLRAPGVFGLAGRVVVFAYVGVLVGLPLAALVGRAWTEGGTAFVQAMTSPIARDALVLSIGVALLTGLLNGIFGTATAWVPARYEFPGRSIVSALVDWLKANAPKSAYVSLIADGPAKDLYAQYGFKETAPVSVGRTVRGSACRSSWPRRKCRKPGPPECRPDRTSA